jgi:aspartyl-tRNA(Asn)/glutamyl-tRNA(Gln) amidotransferase subunit B
MDAFTRMGLSEYDAGILCQDEDYALYFENLCTYTPHVKAAANVVINKIIPWSEGQEKAIQQFPIPAAGIAGLLGLIADGLTNATQAYQQLWPRWMESPEVPLDQMMSRLGLSQNQDETFLQGLVEEVLIAFPEKVAEYHKGKKGLLAFFMGAIMKASKGKAAPAKVQELLENALKKPV